MTGAVVGIDLGTTNTVVGLATGAELTTLADTEGQRLLPSVVSFHPNGSVLVGRSAKERRFLDARNTIYSVKRLIGRSWSSEEVNEARARFPFEMREGPGNAALVVARGETYTLPEISAFVLRKAKQIAEASLGSPVERAVITVPANFNDLQRAATKVAGRVAGLEVMRILNEPTAAALAYGYGRGRKERIAVYDFGGGTFDVTLLDLSGDVFEVLATAGDTFLGGDDIDLAIAERMADEFLAEHNYDPRSHLETFERLRAAAEILKLRLTQEQSAVLQIDDLASGPGGRGIQFTFALSRSELDQLASRIVDQTFDVCREAFGIARLDPSSFDQVLLVGGTTRMPLVRERVEQFFKRPPMANISPDEVVAMGAAIQAAALGGPDRRRATVPLPPVPARRESAPDLPEPRPRIDTSPGIAPPPSPFGRSSSAPPSAPSEPVKRPLSNAAAPSMSAGEAALRARIAEQEAALNATQAIPELPLVGLGTTSRLPPQPSTAPGGAPGPLGTLVMTPSPSPENRVSGPPLVGKSAGPASPAAAASLAQTSSSTGMLGPPRARMRTLPLEEELDGLPLVGAVPGGRDHSRFPAQPSSPAAQMPSSPAAALTSAPAPSQPSSPALPFPSTPAGRAQPSSVPVAPRSDSPTSARGSTAPFWPVSSVPPAPAPGPATTQRLTLPAANQALGQTAAVAFGQRGSPTPFGGMPPFGDPARALMPLGAAPNEGHRSPPLLIDVTPFSLSVETVGGFCDPIIPRNSPVPCERTRTFATAADQQTRVRVRVAQGESIRFGENTLLGELELTDLRPAARGRVQLAVSFVLDTDGILDVHAKDLSTGKETRAQVKLIGLPDNTDIAGLVARHAAQRTV